MFVRSSAQNGWTALQNATLQGHVDVVEFLIRSRADLNAKDVNGFSSLMYACSYNRADVAELLVRSGADVTITDNVCVCILYSVYCLCTVLTSSNSLFSALFSRLCCVLCFVCSQNGRGLSHYATDPALKAAIERGTCIFGWCSLRVICRFRFVVYAFWFLDFVLKRPGIACSKFIGNQCATATSTADRRNSESSNGGQPAAVVASLSIFALYKHKHRSQG